MADSNKKSHAIKFEAYRTIKHLAGKYKEEGLFNQAEELYIESIALARNLSEPPQILINALYELADFYSFQGKDEKAEDLGEKY